MLAFDIETTGLNPVFAQITCICAEDFHTGQTYTFEFARARKENPASLQSMRNEVCQLFDASSSLCAFNGIQFDLPFMKHELRVPYEQMRAWVDKTSDILESCRKEFRHTFKLDLLCAENQIATKSSTGLEAIAMAKRGDWQMLREYCAQDVHILCELYTKRHLVNPRNKKTMDLNKWCHASVYGDPAHGAPAGGEADVVHAIELKTDNTPLDPLQTRVTACQEAICRRLQGLSMVVVTRDNMFGVSDTNQFILCVCPVCDREGFIQEDTQCIGSSVNDHAGAHTVDAIFTCGMQHAYRIRIE